MISRMKPPNRPKKENIMSDNELKMSIDSRKQKIQRCSTQSVKTKTNKQTIYNQYVCVWDSFRLIEDPLTKPDKHSFILECY